MNLHPSFIKTKSLMLKSLLIGSSALVALASGVNAATTFTFDLRAHTGSVTGTGISLTDAHTVQLAAGASGTLVLDIWAQISTDNTVNNVIGIAQITGTIVTSLTSGSGATGSLGNFTSVAPFNTTVNTPISQEISSPNDGIKDLGTTSTNSTSNDILVARNTNQGGGTVGAATTHYSTNLASNSLFYFLLILKGRG